MLPSSVNRFLSSFFSFSPLSFPLPIVLLSFLSWFLHPATPSYLFSFLSFRLSSSLTPSFLVCFFSFSLPSSFNLPMFFLYFLLLLILLHHFVSFLPLFNRCTVIIYLVRYCSQANWNNRSNHTCRNGLNLENPTYINLKWIFFFCHYIILKCDAYASSHRSDRIWFFNSTSVERVVHFFGWVAHVIPVLHHRF